MAYKSFNESQRAKIQALVSEMCAAALSGRSDLAA